MDRGRAAAAVGVLLFPDLLLQETSLEILDTEAKW